LNNTLYPVGGFQAGTTGFTTVKQKPGIPAIQDLSSPSISTNDSLFSGSESEQPLSTSGIYRRSSLNTLGFQEKISVSAMKELALAGGGFPLSGNNAVAGSLCIFIKSSGDMPLRREKQKTRNDMGCLINENADRPGFGIGKCIYLELPSIGDNGTVELSNRFGMPVKVTEEKHGAKRKAAISGGFHDDIRKLEKEAEASYDRIRSTIDDINSIYHNIGGKIGVDRGVIETVKQHVFLQYHYDEETKSEKRFDPDPDIASVWERLISGNNMRPSDKILVLREQLEHKFMYEDGLTYEQAHKKANETYNWEVEFLKDGGSVWDSLA